MVNKSCVYMHQLSDGSLRNGLVTEEEMLFALKMNLLFFDQIVVSAPALLRNHILFQLSEDVRQRQAMRRLYSKYLRPLLTESNKDISAVAESIIRSEKPVGMSDPVIEHKSRYLEKHAEFIGDVNPDYFHSFARSLPRDKFYEACLGLFEHFSHKNQSKNLANFGHGIRREHILHFTKRLHKIEKAKQDSFRVADAYALATSYPRSTQVFIRALCSTVMEWFVAPATQAEFSVSEKASIFIDAHMAVNFEQPDPSSTEVSDGSQTYFEESFPIKHILALDLDEVLELRNTALFVRMRARLQKFRNGKTRGLTRDLKTIYEVTIKDLYRFIEHETRQGRNLVLGDVKQRDRQLIVRPLIKGGVTVAGTSLTSFSNLVSCL
jgi:hypothetical protein